MSWNFKIRSMFWLCIMLWFILYLFFIYNMDTLKISFPCEVLLVRVKLMSWYHFAPSDWISCSWLRLQFVIMEFWFFGTVENIFNALFCLEQLDFLFSLWLYFHFVNQEEMEVQVKLSSLFWNKLFSWHHGIVDWHMLIHYFSCSDITFQSATFLTSNRVCISYYSSTETSDISNLTDTPPMITPEWVDHICQKKPFHLEKEEDNPKWLHLRIFGNSEFTQTEKGQLLHSVPSM